MNYTGQVDATHIPAYCMLVVPQAWTLGVELSFYLFAPFLIRLKTRSLFGICLLSLALRIYLSRIGHGDDPFTYRFFPNELSTFVTGMLGCRFYLHYLKPKEGKKNLRYFGQAALVACLIDILTYNSNHMHETTKHVLSLILFAASIPFIFSLTKNNRFDRKIGDLSYPTYICHILVITLVSMIAIPRWLYNSGLVAPTISLAVAWLLVKLVEHPIDQMRWRNTAKVLRTIGKAP
jgi:peptidoglycan/LPS O-acetylase OafA/YrhL